MPTRRRPPADAARALAATARAIGGCCCVVAGTGVVRATAAAADDGAPAWKLTVGEYRQSAGEGWSTDINLRRTQDWGNAWLGFYNAPREHDRQWRAGADGSIATGPLRWQPSAQVASHRYAAGSLNVEAGERWFVNAGFGRTNLKPNTNLNFDPNDAWSLAAGWRGTGGQSAQALWVRDNRQNPDQRHLHLVWRQPQPGGQRLTADLLWKQGLVDDTMIHRIGATLTWDWPTVFVRLAYDPKVNFSAADMWRFSTGVRF